MRNIKKVSSKDNKVRISVNGSGVEFGYEYPLAINWASYGDVDIKFAKKFYKVLGRAIRLAEKLG